MQFHASAAYWACSILVLKVLTSIVAQAEAVRLTGTPYGVLGINATFDYVIIGGGTAGLTIAKRLSENSSISVAVIEAGGYYEQDNGNISQIPAYASQYSSSLVIDGKVATPQPLIDWSFITQPQPGLDDRQLHYTQGKTLGGSSARNYMAYHRPTVGAMSMWASMVNDASYEWDSILPYYEKSPHSNPPDAAKIGSLSSLIDYDSNVFRESGGPLQISYQNYIEPIEPYIATALNEIGVEPIDGLNSGNLLGWAFATATIDPDRETRSSSQTSFLKAALADGAALLTLYKNTVAEKILFDANHAATGVAVTTAEVPYILSARNEVILSAGVFKSPQLLMLSGIGPSSTLDAHGIPILSDLPGVGQNLWDQPLFYATYRVNVTTASALEHSSYLYHVTDLYLNNQTGPLTSPGAGILGFENLPPPNRANLSTSAIAALNAFPDDWPEFELLPEAAPFSAVPDDSMYASSAVVLLTPTSRGNVTISSANINDQPLISPNWLLAPEDQEIAVQGFKRARALAQATGIIVGEEFLPGENVTTDAEILAYLRESTIPIHHASATCAMGRANDTMAVLDSRARVRGVKGVRVVDASAFPFTPPGHIQSSVYMLAEKIADDIKSGWS